MARAYSIVSVNKKRSPSSLLHLDRSINCLGDLNDRDILVGSGNTMKSALFLPKNIPKDQGSLHRMKCLYKACRTLGFETVAWEKGEIFPLTFILLPR